MADTNYLYYGDQQVDQQALMNKMANGVVQYVQSQPWTRKRKDMFMSAYSDIMNNGLKGMSNNTGQWMVDFGGPTIDWDSKSRKEKEMYEEAGYFIQQQMSGLATKPEEEKEEEDKKELTKFKNEDFVSSFTNRLVNDWFGGNITNYSNQWNDYDERGENGLRGINQRAGMLATSLRNYLDSLKDDQYDFTDSPFANIDDFKTKIQTAISTLESDNKDLNQIKKSLNAIGLDANEWFNNGSGDPYVDENGRTVAGSDGKPLSYAEYYNNLALQEKTKQETEQKAAEEKQKALDALQVYTSRPVQKALSLIDISNKYNGDLNAAIANFKNANLSQLTQEQNDELVSLFQGGYNRHALNDISDEEWEQIKAKVATNGEDRSQYRKINGINGIYYDIAKQNLFQLGNFQQSGNENFLAGLSDKEQKEIRDLAQSEYLQNTEWTADQWRELGGIAADVVSVIDPEPVSAGISALTGTGLRTWNRIFDKDGFTLSDFGHTALDTGLSLLGMIPIVGDAALTARVLGKLQKAAGWLGGIFAAASVPQAAKSAWDKVVNGKDLTVDDWRAIGNVFMGLTQARRIQLNRAAGNAVKNSNGGTKTEKVGEVEVKIGDKVEKVQIGEQAAKELKADYQKAGNNLEETNRALRRSEKVREQLEAKKGSDGKPLYTKEQLDAMEAPQAAAGSIQGRNPIRGLRPTRGITTTTRTVTTEGTPITENSPLRVQYAANNQGFFGRGNYGWNINGRTGNESKSWFRRQWDNLVNPYRTPEAPVKTPVETPKTEIKPTETPISQDFIPQGVSTNTMQKINRALGRNNNYRSTGSAKKLPNPKLNGSKQPLIDGSTYKLSFDGDKTFTISYNGTDIPITGKTLQEAKINLGKKVDEINSKLKLPENFTKDSKEWQNMLKSIKELKREGYFMKQGGKITDIQIDNFLKQYKI